MLKKRNWTLVFSGIIGLFFIRAFETSLFYDPLTDHLKKSVELTEVIHLTKTIKFYFDTCIRYMLNTFFCAIIILGFFGRRLSVTFTKYTLFALIPLVIIYYLGIQAHNRYSMGLFYFRRILIQPMLGILAFLTFYYLEITEKSSE